MILCAWTEDAVPSRHRTLSRSLLEAAADPSPGASAKRPDTGADFHKRFMGFPSELCISYLVKIRFLILNMSSEPRKCSRKSFALLQGIPIKASPRVARSVMALVMVIGSL